MTNKILFTLSVMLFIGCGTIEIENETNSTASDTNNSTGINTPPTANAGSDRTVNVGESITIAGSGTDSDGTIIEYEWLEGTQIISGRQTFEYTASQEGNITLTLRVYDDDGVMGTDTMVVIVTP